MIASLIQGYKQDIGESREISNENEESTTAEPVLSQMLSNSINDPPISVPAETDAPITPDVQFKCKQVGRFAYPGSCEKYYFCWDKNEDDDFRVFTCPQNTAFDPITQLCVRNFAVCALASKCELDSKRILPNPDDKSTFFQCKYLQSSKKMLLQKRACAVGREFDADLGYCKSKFAYDDFLSLDSNDDSSEKVLECEKPGIFKDYSNDSDYYECQVKSVSSGKLKLIHHSCPRHHIFTMIDKRCVSLLEIAGWAGEGNGTVE